MANTPATPRTWVAGAVLTAAQLNADVRDNTDFLLTSAPAVRVYNSANISISNNTVTALTFDTERYDVGSGMHSTSVNTGRLTVPTGCGGKYHIGASLVFAANATGRRYAAIRLNGTTLIAIQIEPTNSGTYATGIQVSCDYALAAADYVEVEVYQDSGGALNVTFAGNYSPEFWAHWVRT